VKLDVEGVVEIAGVLKAKVGGQWVPIVGSGMSAEAARWNSAWGVVAEAAAVTDQGGIVGTFITLNSLSVTFVPVVGRRYIYRVKVELQSTVAGDVPVLSLTNEANASFDRHTGRLGGTATETWAWTSMTEAFSTTASVTRRLGLSRAIGTGTLTATADYNRPNKLIVEDVGPITPSAVAPPNPTPAWIPFTLLNGYTAVSGRTPQYRMVGDEVQCRGTALTPASLTNVPVTFPAGFRPAIPSAFPLASWQSGFVPGRAYVTTDGVLALQHVMAAGGEQPFETVRFSVTP